jgi:two-component system, NtrC family, response regulator AtoC
MNARSYLVSALRGFLEWHGFGTDANVRHTGSIDELLQLERPPQAGQTIIYDTRGQSTAGTVRDIRRIHDLAPESRLVLLSDGGMPLDVAALAVRVADAEYDLSLMSLEEVLHLPPAVRSLALPECFCMATPQGEMFTASRELRDVLHTAHKVAAQPMPVVLTGETGVGKTTMARYLHDWSDRAAEPFMVLPCGAVPGDLLEADLFGHVRGAFTSANETRLGRLEAVGNGSLFLDEIDLLGLKQQAKLLRVVESGAFEPVGSNQTRYTNCRLIFASNVDLERLVASQQFRSDLLFRINVVELCIPPLRERLDDVPLLAVRCLQDAMKDHAVEDCRVHLEFLRDLRRYHWPGNIRELKNRLLRALVLSADGCLRADDLGLLPKSLQTRSRADTGRHPGLEREVRSATSRAIVQMLVEKNYNRTATARALGISRATLYRKLDVLQIDVSALAETVGQASN